MSWPFHGKCHCAPKPINVKLSNEIGINGPSNDMHELAVTESILEIALRHGQAAGAARITDLHLVIGELSSIVDESVQFYWDIISEGTAAAGATLHFRRVPARLVCQVCGHDYSPRQTLPCPACGSADVRVTAGEEFYLEAIDVIAAGDEDAISAEPTDEIPAAAVAARDMTQ
jgi:hydrogenase nickel incorporation protein HypA/HybF